MFHVKQHLSGQFSRDPYQIDSFLRHTLAEFCPGESTLHIEQWSARLARYADLLFRWSQRVNLISSGDRTQISAKHLLPSVALRQLILTVPHTAVWDVGSGGGLPGIPLAITLPEARFLLVESRRRRASFLREVIRRLSLKNSSVLNERLEQDGQISMEFPKAEVVLSRAALGLDELRSMMKGRTLPNATLITTLPPSAPINPNGHTLVHRWQCSGFAGSAGLQEINGD